MHWLEDHWIGNVLGRGSRTVLGLVSAVIGVVMVVSAPPTDKAFGFYLISLFCFLICVSCIGSARVRHLIGSAVGLVLVACSLWYVFEVATKGSNAARFGPPSLINALVLFLFLGIPGLMYVGAARFGIRRVMQGGSGADPVSPEPSKSVFYRVDPWNLVTAVVALTFGLIQIARSTTLWILRVPLFLARG
jgi:hypothetical protein